MGSRPVKFLSRSMVVKRLKRLQRQRDRLNAERDAIDEQIRYIRKHCEHKQTDYDGLESYVCRDCGLVL